MSTTLITPVRGRLDHLRALASGLASSPDRPDEFLVAHMGGDDPRPALAGCPVEVTVLPVEAGGDLPLSAARNLGAERARGDVLVFLDVDCVPDPGLFAAYSSLLAGTDGLAVGRTRYQPGDPRDGYRVPHEERFREAVTAGDDYAEFWSLNFAIRRETFWSSLRGFDEGFSGYGIEDTDFAREAERVGLPLLWVRAASAVHLHHPPSRFESDRLPPLVRNAKRFRRKWGTWPAEGWLDELAARGMVDWDRRADRLEVA